MRLGPSGGDDLIPHFFGEGNIYQIIAVDVADFSPS